MQLQQKLHVKEFYDVYGISLLVDKVCDYDLEFLCDILNPIAEKYVNITLDAVRRELRYSNYGGDSRFDYRNLRWNKNKKILSSYKIRNIRSKETRFRIDFELAIKLYTELEWESSYGGEAWADIAIAGNNLSKILPVTKYNIKSIVSAIDKLNDLEHNNALYMSENCSFKFNSALDDKYSCDEKSIFRKCSKEIRDIYKEVVVK
jgi:hypothetical protein